MSAKGPLGPIVVTRKAEEAPDPAAAPPVADVVAELGQGRAMVTATAIAARPVGRIAKLLLGAVGALVLLWVSAATWDFVVDLLGRNIWLGRGALVLCGIILIAAVWVIGAEMAGFSRLARIDALRRQAGAVREAPDAEAVEALTGSLMALYRSRDDLAWARDTIAHRADEVMDPSDRLDLIERELMSPLDAAARAEVERSARQVAMVTAIVPLALADVVTALVANTRMVRRIAEVYGGRTGTFGSWRLIRAVAAHLVATGAVGVADDLISTVAGGGAVAKLSRRFGEGIINGALTARVGLAAMDICRPLPFVARDRPRVRDIVGTALTGVFSKG